MHQKKKRGVKQNRHFIAEDKVEGNYEQTHTHTQKSAGRHMTYIQHLKISHKCQLHCSILNRKVLIKYAYNINYICTFIDTNMQERIYILL